ncbi:MAG: transposase, partial [Bacteroidetes bacterium]|nr:transposase [Bacteroidota bacterium]
YKKLHGQYPEAVIVDRIYATLENRKWLKDKEIRITAKPLGRPGPETGEQARLRRQEQRERNQIEGKFGQAKNGYANACLWHRLNQVRTRLRATAESWIGCIIFITNLIKWQKDYFIVLIFFQPKTTHVPDRYYQNRSAIILLLPWLFLVNIVQRKSADPNYS